MYYSYVEIEYVATSFSPARTDLALKLLTNLCKKNISNAFENVPFGDLKYGLLGSVPAEMLHVSGTGLLKHMFGCLDNLIGGPNSKKKIRNHLMIYTIV
jgi:hypothetical protein